MSHAWTLIANEINKKIYEFYKLSKENLPETSKQLKLLRTELIYLYFYWKHLLQFMEFQKYASRFSD